MFTLRPRTSSPPTVAPGYAYNCSELILLPTRTTGGGGSVSPCTAHCDVLERAGSAYIAAHMPQYAHCALVELRYASRIFSCMNTVDDVRAAVACAQAYVRETAAAGGAAGRDADTEPRRHHQHHRGAVTTQNLRVWPCDADCVAVMVSFDAADSVARQLCATHSLGTAQVQHLSSAGTCATEAFIAKTQNAWLCAISAASGTVDAPSSTRVDLPPGITDAAALCESVAIDDACVPRICHVGAPVPAAAPPPFGSRQSTWPRWCAQLVCVLHTFFMCPFIALATDEHGAAWVVYARIRAPPDSDATEADDAPGTADVARDAAAQASVDVKLHLCALAPSTGDDNAVDDRRRRRRRAPRRVTGTSMRRGAIFPIHAATGAANAATAAGPPAPPRHTRRVYGCDGAAMYRLDALAHAPQLALCPRGGFAWLASAASPLARAVAHSIHRSAAATAAAAAPPPPPPPPPPPS